MDQQNKEGICATCESPLEISRSNANKGQHKKCRKCYIRKWYADNYDYATKKAREYYSQTRPRRLQVAKERRDAMSPEERNKNNRQIAYKRKYNLTIEQYETMHAEQNGLCFLCGKESTNGKPLSVDHCHVKKEIRKLLCQTCNFFLGIIERDPDWVQRALLYLKTDH
jgi:hypothetical protein